MENSEYFIKAEISKRLITEKLKIIGTTMKNITLLILIFLSCLSHSQTESSANFYTSTEFNIAAGQFRVYKLNDLNAANGSCWELTINKAYNSTEWLASNMLVFIGDEDSKFAKISANTPKKDSDEVYVSFLNAFKPDEETNKVKEFIFLNGIKIGEPVVLSFTITKKNEVKIVSKNRLYSYDLGFSPVEIGFGASSSYSTIKQLNLNECKKQKP